MFDHETRNYYSTDNVYSYENFSHRIDALRHHDKRRELLRRGEDQPFVLNDFEDDNATAVRSLYLEPNAPPPRVDAWGGEADPPLPLSCRQDCLTAVPHLFSVPGLQFVLWRLT